MFSLVYTHMDILSLALSWDRSQKLITIVKVTKARRVG